MPHTSRETPAAEADRLRARAAELEARLQAAEARAAEAAAETARWRSIFRHAHDVVVLTDREGRVQAINWVHENYSVQEVQGAVGLDYIAPQHRAAVKAAETAAFSGEDTQLEFCDVRNSRWFRAHIGPVETSGPVTQVVSICTEITDARRREEALRESEEKLRLLIEQAPAILTCVDADLRFTYSAGAGLAALGLRPGEVVGRLMPEFFRRYDAQFPPLQAVHRALAGQASEFELEWKGRLYHSHVEPMRDAAGQIAGAIGVSLDVTEVQRAERESRESRSRFQQMAENIRDVFYLIDPLQDELLYVSPAYDEIWGRPAAAAPRDRSAFLRAIHPADRAAVEELTQRSLSSRLAADVEYRVVRPDGAVRWIHDRWFPILASDGSLLRVAGVAHDITARKLAELELLRLQLDLEERVRERTLACARASERLEEANRRLAHTNERLEEANRLLARANAQLQEDIARREQAETNLRASEERCRLIVESMPIPVCITRTTDGRILYANQRLGEAFGMELSQVVGRSARDFYAHPADRDKLMAQLQREGGVRDHEMQGRLPDGRIRWLAASVRPIDYNGERALLTALVDLTHRREAEESLRQERTRLLQLLESHETERQMVAYEIHDAVVQNLVAARMVIDTASHQAQEAGADEDSTALGLGARLVSQSIDEARRVINGLRPPVLEQEGLVAALCGLTVEMRANVGLEVDFRHAIAFTRAAPALEHALYRTAQEALNNVWQHSGVKFARLELRQTGEIVTLTVEDEGGGFDPSTAEGRRYGLRGIQDRARLMGGFAEILSAPGCGARVTVELPLEGMLPAQE